MIIRSAWALLLSVQWASAEWKPCESRLKTSWGEQVNPASVWSEYPRPQLQRAQWKNLNGLWSYSITPAGPGPPEKWDGEILVPFPPEAPLSGVGRQVSPEQNLWYRKTFTVDAPAGKKTILHFGAVDYEAWIFLNGKQIGTHKGGHTPFSFDITAALVSGENELSLRVLDVTEGFQLHGKQTLKPRGIWYGNITGIWQSVWYEHVPKRSIEALDFSCDVKTGRLDVGVRLAGAPLPEEKIRLAASMGGTVLGRAEGLGKLSVQFKDPKLWTPEHPHLYDLQIELLDAKGRVVDTVKSYSALREVGKARDAKGNLLITMNGEPLFLLGPLDQGWWPEGMLTPPSDAAMIAELTFIKDAGFNMLRKHVKIEPARYYYHCDRMGIAVWQDQVSSNYNGNAPDGATPRWIRMAQNPVDGVWPPEAHEQWVLEYKRMVDHLRNHPSVVIWSPFNEAWGQHQSMEIGRMAVDYDKTRLVSIASGGNFWPVGDIAAEHAYPGPGFPFKDARFADYIKAMGEMGGHGWAVPGHTWQAEKSWGYGGLAHSLDDWKFRYARSMDQLRSMRASGIAAAVYTQTYDIELELNGLMTYDRIPKVDPSWLKDINRKVFETQPARTPDKNKESVD